MSILKTKRYVARRVSCWTVPQCNTQACHSTFCVGLACSGLSPEDSVTVVEPDKPSPVRVLLSGAKFLDRPLWLITVVIVSAYFATSFVFYGLTLNSGSFTSNIYLSFFISSVMQVRKHGASLCSPRHKLSQPDGSRTTVSAIVQVAFVHCS